MKPQQKIAGACVVFETAELLGQIVIQIYKILSPIVKSYHLTITELIILWKIHRKGWYRLTDLAEEAGKSPSTLTGIIDRLEKQGYIVRTHDRKDRRSIIVEGTPRLHILIEEVMQRTDHELAQTFSGLPAGFMEQLTQNLEQLQIYLSQKVNAQQQ